MAESGEELKSLLMKVKVESEKVDLKLNIQKMKIMASGPITSWQIDGETVETVADFIFGGSKITAGEGNGTPFQYCCLENPVDGGAWWAVVHGVAEGRTRLSDFTFTFHFHALEEEMSTHSSVLAWRIPGSGEPGGLLSMGSHRVGLD